MSSNPWATTFCCQAQTTAGPVDLDRAVVVADEWAASCFAEPDRPKVEIYVSTEAEWDIVRLEDYRGAPLTSQNFIETSFLRFDYLTRPDSRKSTTLRGDTVIVVIGRTEVCLMYSHLLGDETVFYPKSRRLFLALSGVPCDGVPPMTDRRALTARRIVTAAADLVVRSPKRTAGSLVRRHAQRRLAPAVQTTPDVPMQVDVTANPQAFWIAIIRLERGGLRKIPSVLLFCAMLSALDLDPTVDHHVVTDLRGYSPILHETAGNALSHIPFAADWSTQTPTEVAAAIATRIRNGEPLLRRAVAIMLGWLRVAGSARRGEQVEAEIPAVAKTLTTSMSYFRVPAGRAHPTTADHPFESAGIQTPANGVLSVNAREEAGVAHLAISHRGGIVDCRQALRAVHAAAAELGCTVLYETAAEHVVDRAGARHTRIVGEVSQLTSNSFECAKKVL